MTPALIAIAMLAALALAVSYILVVIRAVDRRWPPREEVVDTLRVAAAPIMAIGTLAIVGVWAFTP